MPALEDGCPCRPKQRHERSERHHAFTRQPTRPPLRKRPPCTLRIAKVERGGKKSDRDEKQRKNMRQFGKSQRRIEQAEAQHSREPVSEAGKRRKDDDRGGGMHGRLASPPRVRVLPPPLQNFSAKVALVVEIRKAGGTAPPSVLPDISPARGEIGCHPGLDSLATLAPDGYRAVVGSQPPTVSEISAAA